MSSILVDITSQTADTPSAGFTEVTDLVDTVVVPSGGVVLIMAVVPLDLNASDEAADFRFAIDDVLDGPEVTAFKDTTNEGCGVALCFAITGLSGSTKFALQWRNRIGVVGTDTDRVRSFQVVHITDASLLTDISSTSAQSATSGYDDVADFTDTKTPASADSILVMVANMVGAINSSDNTASFQFTVGGSAVGPESKAFEDAVDEGCGMSQVWCLTGQSGSTAFALQWDELQASMQTDTGRERTFQIIEITANANLLTAVTSVAADALTSSFTDVVDMVDTVTVQGTDSILLFFAMMPLLRDVDKCAAFRVFEGGTGEGPEQYVFADETADFDEACGHSVYHAVTGKSAGSHTFSIRGQNVQGTANLSTDQRRSFAILELVAAVAQVDKEASDTLGLEIDETLTELLASTDRVDDLDLAIGEAPADLKAFLERQEALDLAIVEGVGQIQAGLTAEDVLDLAIIESPADVLVPITVVDDLDLAIVEGVPEIVVSIAVVDDLDLAVVEAVSVFVETTGQDDLDIAIVEAVDLLGLIEVADILDLAVVEDPAGIAVGIEAIDDLDLAILEGVGEVAVMVDVVEDLDLEIGEGVPDLLGFIEPVDQTGLAADELADLLSAAERLDTLGLAIAEVAEVTVAIDSEDVLDLAIGEVADACLTIEVEDTLALAVVEQVDLLALLERADTISLALVEGVPVVFVTVTGQDLIDLAIGEVATVQVPIEVTDNLDLAVVEDLAEILVGITATDLLSLSIDEVAQVVAFLNRSDILALQIGEVADLQAFIEAADSLDVAIDDVVSDLCVVLIAADNLGIAIGEVAQVLNLLTAIDTLGLAISELPADLVITDAFVGLLVQVIKLEVQREASFKLVAAREAKFTLQIEGSGEQQ